jgi:lysophospholipase L1-like esterase
LVRSLVALLAFGTATYPGILTAQTPSGTTPLQYTALQTPCRAVDTRVTGGPIAAGTSQSFYPAAGACNIPLPSTGPIVYALNVTVVPHGPLGYLSVWPTGATQPLVSTLNSPDGRVKANAALATGGNGGEISVYASNTTDLVLDVSGYFTYAPAADVYVPVTPCRVVDTRISNGTSFGAPSLAAGQQRTFRLANSNCNLPATAFGNGGAVSLNVTAVPIAGHPVSYVTVWGISETEPQTPLISTLNVPMGTVTANASLVTINPSTSESVSVYSSDNTDLVLDITGYFAPASLAPSGLSLYTLPPCRVIDTRESSGEFQGELTVPFATGNNCSIPASAQAYVMNATVVPSGSLGFLTLWPDGIPQPLVSTLNAEDGSVTSNMAIVSSTNGSIDAFASSDTQLILDVSGYFASPPGPTVVFVGDQVTVNMFAQPRFQAQHPNWVNAGVTGETTAQALAAFQAQCISPHPQVCNVMIGLNDIQTWLPYPPGEPSIESQEVQVLQDLSQMLQEATAAGIRVVFATEFPSLEDFTSLDSEAPADVYANGINAWLTDFPDDPPSDWPPFPTAAVIANYWSPLVGNCGLIAAICDYLPGLSTDDIVPNAAGYAAMYPVLASAVQQALSSIPSSSAKPTTPLTNKAEKPDF